MVRLTPQQIARYADSREGVGKAGGYAIQGMAEVFVKEISGSWSNVVGLPLAMVAAMLAGAGYVP
jgi:septum formation protein